MISYYFRKKKKKDRGSSSFNEIIFYSWYEERARGSYVKCRLILVENEGEKRVFNEDIP